MEINPDYLFSLIAFFKKKEGKFPISELTKTPTKFITHVKYYIDCRPREYPDVHFTEDYQNIIINHLLI